MTALLAAAVAVAGGTQLFGWTAAPAAGVVLGIAEAARRGPGRAPGGFAATVAPADTGAAAGAVARGARSALVVSARGAAAGAAGWAFLLLWRGLEAPVWEVAGLIGSVAGGAPKSLVVVFALALPALLAGTAAGAAAAVSSVAFGAAESRRRDP